MTPIGRLPEPEDATAFDPVRIATSGRLHDVGAQEREVGALLLHQQALDAVVELVVAIGCGLQPPRILDIDGGQILQQTGIGRRSAHIVARSDQQWSTG